MKKLIAILMRTVFALSLAACSGSGKTEPADGGKDETPKDFELVRGTWDSAGTHFENPSTGIKITLPSSTWGYYSEDELAQSFLSGVTGDQLAAWTREDIKDRQIIPDAAAIDYGSGNNLNLQYENLAKEGASSVTAEQYVDISLTRLKNNSQYTIESDDPFTLELNGEKYTAVHVKTSTSSISVDQLLCARKVGNYMVVLVMTKVDGSDFTGFYDMFK